MRQQSSWERHEHDKLTCQDGKWFGHCFLLHVSQCALCMLCIHRTGAVLSGTCMQVRDMNCMQVTRRVHIKRFQQLRADGTAARYIVADHVINTSVCEELFSSLGLWQPTLQNLSATAAEAFMHGWVDHWNERVLRKRGGSWHHLPGVVGQAWHPLQLLGSHMEFAYVG